MPPFCSMARAGHEQAGAAFCTASLKALGGGPAHTPDPPAPAPGALQALTGRLFALPSEPAPVGRIAELPPPTTVLPREKPLPKPRPPTKWELFAQASRRALCWVPGLSEQPQGEDGGWPELPPEQTVMLVGGQFIARAPYNWQGSTAGPVGGHGRWAARRQAGALPARDPLQALQTPRAYNPSPAPRRPSLLLARSARAL